MQTTHDHVGEGRTRIPFARQEFERDPVELCSIGSIVRAKVSVFRKGSGYWVVKDFRPLNLLVRWTWGQFLLRRELRAFERLRGVRGVPQDAFRLDRFALAYRYVPGISLRKANPDLLKVEFFTELESLVLAIHARDIVHLDMRYSRNILVGEDGRPTLLDFQTHGLLERVPGFMHPFLKEIDLSGVYKHWNRARPGTLGPKREALLARQKRLRRLWFLKAFVGSRPVWRGHLRWRRAPNTPK
jgi:hypothetical protein